MAPGWDVLLPHKPETGLAVDSVLRPGFLGVVTIDTPLEVIGRVDPATLAAVRSRLRAALA